MERHYLIRSLVRVCSGRSRLTRIASTSLKLAADAATHLRATALEQKAYSGLFNLQYYNGFFNELDDGHFLFKDLEKSLLDGD